MSAAPVLVLTGPTGSGKSDWALRLAEALPLELISVDSAQVFRGLDIGTAKPDAAVRARVPHHLLDIRDPAERYSAGEFVADAREAIQGSQARGRLPVLVGGTMLYLRALLRGMAPLPRASPTVRAALDAEAAALGWPALHAQLAGVDARAAARIHPNDPQRIQRALEVYRLTGRAISDWQESTPPPLPGIEWLRYALVPADRAVHARALTARFDAMLEQGLLAEVGALFRRRDLHAELPALRSVGYRQLWMHFANGIGLQEARGRAVVATCQLAKRQLTWLRGEPGYRCLDPGELTGLKQVLRHIRACGFMA